MFFHETKVESTKTAESKLKNNNAQFATHQGMVDPSGAVSKKLSMKQIDSVTALMNYKFTLQNRNKDIIVLPVDSVTKSKKL